MYVYVCLSINVAHVYVVVVVIVVVVVVVVVMVLVVVRLKTAHLIRLIVSDCPLESIPHLLLCSSGRNSPLLSLCQDDRRLVAHYCASR